MALPGFPARPVLGPFRGFVLFSPGFVASSLAEVNKNCDLKICDFGLSRVLATESEDALGRTDYVVTRWYRAPEVGVLRTRKVRSG